MGISTASGSMTSAEIAALSKQHTIFSWSVQGAVDPIAIDHAEGVYLYTPEGQRILDFNSQLMSVNIGHGDRRVIDAITEQALKLQYVQPAFATEVRARLGPSSPRSCRATWTRCSSPSAAPRRSRTRSSSPAIRPASTSCSPGTAPTTAPRPGR